MKTDNKIRFLQKEEAKSLIRDNFSSFKDSFVSQWLNEDYQVSCFFVGKMKEVKCIALIRECDNDPFGDHKNPKLLNYIFTKPEYRSRGFALKLLKHLIEKKLEITLFTSPAEHKLFLKSGFSIHSFAMKGASIVMRSPDGTIDPKQDSKILLAKILKKQTKKESITSGKNPSFCGICKKEIMCKCENEEKGDRPKYKQCSLNHHHNRFPQMAFLPNNSYVHVCSTKCLDVVTKMDEEKDIKNGMRIVRYGDFKMTYNPKHTSDEEALEELISMASEDY